MATQISFRPEEGEKSRSKEEKHITVTISAKYNLNLQINFQEGDGDGDDELKRWFCVVVYCPKSEMLMQMRSRQL